MRVSVACMHLRQIYNAFMPAKDPAARGRDLFARARIARRDRTDIARLVGRPTSGGNVALAAAARQLDRDDR